MVQCSLHEAETPFIVARALTTKAPESSCLLAEIYDMVDGIVSYYILFKWLHLKKNVKYVQIFYLMHTDICTCVLKHNNYNAKFSPDKNIQQIQKNTTAIQLPSGIRSHPTQATHTHLLSCFPVICGMDVAIPLPPAFVKK